MLFGRGARRQSIQQLLHYAYEGDSTTTCTNRKDSRRVGRASALSAKTKIAWSLPKTANAHASAPFSWTAKHVTRSNHTVVERREGSAEYLRVSPEVGSGVTSESNAPLLGSPDTPLGIGPHVRLVESRRGRAALQRRPEDGAHRRR